MGLPYNLIDDLQQPIFQIKIALHILNLRPTTNQLFVSHLYRKINTKRIFILFSKRSLRCLQL